MWKELDAVPWGQLTHACGTATDVPKSLRALANGDRYAIDALYENLWHQGSIFEATAHAVPFLVQLLDHEAVDVAEVLHFLHVIANGSSYTEVHRDHLRKSRRASEETARAIDRERGWVRATHEAVVAGVPVYLRLLAESPAGRARQSAAFALGACRGAAMEIVPNLCERIATEASPLVRASLVLAVDDLGRGDLAEAWMSDPEPLPRVAAALARARPGEIDERVLHVLVEDAPRCFHQLETLDWVMDHGDPLRFVTDRLAVNPEVEARLLSRWIRAEESMIRSAALFRTEDLITEWRSGVEQLVPALAFCLDDPDRELRRTAARRLEMCGRTRAKAADALFALLEREGLKYGEPSAFALRALCRMRDPRAAEYVARALEYLAPPQPSWRKMLRSRTATFTVELPEALACSLDLLGAWAEPCFEALVRLIAVVPAGEVRSSVIRAVGSFGERAALALPQIRAELGRHALVSTRVLGDLGVLAAKAFDDVQALLSHGESKVRANAARAMWRMAGRPEVALRVLRENLELRPARARGFTLCRSLPRWAPPPGRS